MPVLNSHARKLCYEQKKIRKQAGMVFTPASSSQNYEEVILKVAMIMKTNPDVECWRPGAEREVPNIQRAVHLSYVHY